MNLQENTTHLACCDMADLFDGFSMEKLAWLHRHPEHEAHQLVEVECSQECGTKITCKKFVAAITACDACRAKAERSRGLERVKSHWEKICPPGSRYADTNKDHPAFPKRQYEELKEWKGESSLMLYGDTRTGKTRLAMLLLKRAMLAGKWATVVWPEQLKAVKNSRDILDLLKKYGSYDVLLLDDALLTGAQDERITDFLKDLLDYMMRYNRRFIITSQIGSDDFKQQANKFDNITEADKKRIEALLARIKEETTTIPFYAAQEVTGTTPF